MYMHFFVKISSYLDACVIVSTVILNEVTMHCILPVKSLRIDVYKRQYYNIVSVNEIKYYFDNNGNDSRSVAKLVVNEWVGKSLTLTFFGE